MAQFTAVTDRPTIVRIMASKRRRELISTIPARPRLPTRLITLDNINASR
jgi:hypothetical protein